MKEQSARIAQEKIEELWKFFPALKNEIIDQRGAKNSSSFQRDYIKLVFKNGSYLDIVAARQSSRGKIKIFDHGTLCSGGKAKKGWSSVT